MNAAPSGPRQLPRNRARKRIPMRDRQQKRSRVGQMQKAKANSSKRHRFVRHKNLADCVGTKEHLTLTSTRWQEVYSWTHGGGSVECPSTWLSVHQCSALHSPYRREARLPHRKYKLQVGNELQEDCAKVFVAQRFLVSWGDDESCWEGTYLPGTNTSPRRRSVLRCMALGCLQRQGLGGQAPKEDGGHARPTYHDTARIYGTQLPGTAQ